MSRLKKLLMALLILLLFGAVGGGVIWNVTYYTFVDMRFYPRDARLLDLRGEDISAAHYARLRKALPECEVLWDIPFQGVRYSQDTKSLTVTALSRRDVEVLAYFPELMSLEAKDCRDYEMLLMAEEQLPELDICYSVMLGEQSFPRDAETVELMQVRAEEIPRLNCFTGLEKVVVRGGEAEAVDALRTHCGEIGADFCVGLGETVISGSARKVTAEAVTEAELAMLQFLPDLKTLHLEDPEAPAETLLQLRRSLLNVDITWEKTVCGVSCSSEDKEVDLSGAKIHGLDKVRREMAYFPKAETLFLGKCGIDNERLAAFRAEMREQYKVVWTVQLGKKLTARTDDTTFMPVREHVYYFNDEEAYDLRYCEEMVCIDIGHMSITDISFVENMPNLEFLILAHTQVQYIEPIRSCKKLKFLELDWSPIKDYSPLLDCTALEDLNLGNTYADFAPVGKMTWLKNLWMIGCSRGPAYRMTQALTDTKVMVTGSATVANGWRDLENYYEMRDLLGMHYMSW